MGRWEGSLHAWKRRWRLWGDDWLSAGFTATLLLHQGIHNRQSPAAAFTDDMMIMMAVFKDDDIDVRDDDGDGDDDGEEAIETIVTNHQGQQEQQ